MSSEETNREWCWEEGTVPETAEHILLTYKHIEEPDDKPALQVARVGQPKAKTFPVEFLIDALAAKNRGICESAKKELDFYSADTGDKNTPPWNYMQSHCTTSSNIYSDIHWNHVKPESQIHLPGYD